MGNRWDVTREVKAINEQQDNGRLQSGRQTWEGLRLCCSSTNVMKKGRGTP